MSANTTVFVSGATGYIALHIVRDLLAAGYTVIGSVRSVEKGDKITKQFNNSKFSYEVVKDIAAPGAFDEALKKHPETDIFLHTASPFHFHVTDVEKELLIPAVEGTKNALNAIKAYGKNVKKVVVTSSYAAMFDHTRENDPTQRVDESSWNNLTWEQAKENPLAGYVASKAFAERAAWDFVKEEKPQFKLITVNPVYVFGPQNFKEDVKGTLNTSAEIINGLLKLKQGDPIPEYNGLYIDVRDVAKAHLVAFENPAAEGQRLMLADQRFNSQQVLNILHAKFPEFTKDIPIGNPDFKIQYSVANNDKTRKILGFPLIDLEKTTVDTVQQILDANK